MAVGFNVKLSEKDKNSMISSIIDIGYFFITSGNNLFAINTYINLRKLDLSKKQLKEVKDLKADIKNTFPNTDETIKEIKKNIDWPEDIDEENDKVIFICFSSIVQLFQVNAFSVAYDFMSSFAVIYPPLGDLVIATLKEMGETELIKKWLMGYVYLYADLFDDNPIDIVNKKRAHFDKKDKE